MNHRQLPLSLKGYPGKIYQHMSVQAYAPNAEIPAKWILIKLQIPNLSPSPLPFLLSPSPYSCHPFPLTLLSIPLPICQMALSPPNPTHIADKRRRRLDTKGNDDVPKLPYRRNSRRQSHNPPDILP